MTNQTFGLAVSQFGNVRHIRLPKLLKLLIVSSQLEHPSSYFFILLSYYKAVDNVTVFQEDELKLNNVFYKLGRHDNDLEGVNENMQKLSSSSKKIEAKLNKHAFNVSPALCSACV